MSPASGKHHLPRSVRFHDDPLKQQRSTVGQQIPKSIILPAGPITLPKSGAPCTSDDAVGSYNILCSCRLDKGELPLLCAGGQGTPVYLHQAVELDTVGKRMSLKK